MSDTHLFFDDFVMPNPDSQILNEALCRAIYGKLDKIDLHLIISMAEAYIHFVGNPGPTKDILDQLKLVRKVVSDKRKTTKEN